MSNRIGNINYSENDNRMKLFSDKTNTMIDEEVQMVISGCLEVTRKLVKDKHDLIQQLSDLLLEKETIDLKQIVEVLGERPFEAKSTYKAYLEEVRIVI